MTNTITTAPGILGLAQIGAALLGIKLDEALLLPAEQIAAAAAPAAPVNATAPAAAPALPPPHIEDDTPLPVSGSGDLLSFADKHSAESL